MNKIEFYFGHFFLVLKSKNFRKFMFTRRKIIPSVFLKKSFRDEKIRSMFSIANPDQSESILEALSVPCDSLFLCVY